MADDSEQVARIRAYLEQHRDTYDQAALRLKLISDGHDAAAVDQALQQVCTARRNRNKRQDWQTPQVVTRFIRSSLIINAIAIVIIGWEVVALGMSESTRTNIPKTYWYFLAFFALEVVVAALLWQRYRATASHILWGLILTLAIPFVFAGSCALSSRL